MNTKQAWPVVVFLVTMIIFVGFLLAAGIIDILILRDPVPIISDQYVLMCTNGGWRLMSRYEFAQPRLWITTSTSGRPISPNVFMVPMLRLQFTTFIIGMFFIIRREIKEWRHRRFDHRQALLEQCKDF